MPRVTHLQTNFTAGELSPRVHGRVDIAKYGNGAEQLRDMLVEIYGGAKRRPSSLFVHETKDSTDVSRLIPFELSSTSAFALEFGDLYIRFYKDDEIIESAPGVPYEIVSPYTAAQAQELDFSQGADTMFLFHENVAPYKLVRFADTSWTLTAVAFVDLPFDENGTYPAATVYPSVTGPESGGISLVAGEPGGAVSANGGLSWSGGSITSTTVGHGLATGNAVRITGATPEGYNTVGAVTVIDPDNFTVPLSSNPGACTAAGSFQQFSGVSVFSAGDVGKIVKINGGVVKIGTYVNTFNVTGNVKRTLSSTAGCIANAWSVHSPAWSAAKGYPRTGTIHEQRLICGGSPTFQQTVWGSSTGVYLDFLQGTADDEAFAFTIASEVVNPIKYLASNRVLLVFTTGGEFTIHGGTEKPLAPTNAQIKLRRNYGCSLVRPVRLRDAELFVQRAGRKVRSFGYQLSDDDWNAPDVSILAEHLTEGNIAGMCWQQEPDSVVWAFRSDGALLSITLDKEQDVTAWEFHEGFGREGTVFVESMTSIPVEDGNQVWMVVRRTIDGNSVRYVERLSIDSTLDCGVYSSGAASITWDGLDHLEGETVRAVGDGRYLGEYVVSGGEIEVSRSSTIKNAGLGYTPRLKLLPPEIQTGMGSASGNAMRTSEVTVRFFETTGCKVNGKVMSFRNLGAGVLDAAPEEFTGVKRIENLGFERGESELEFTQEEPMPFHILSVTRKFTTNDG